ncbi:hypothetical protein BDA96_09G115600 [Sorghum bicolor]|uniref:Uncharacterized protein n=2 Tax=Sorghum bicolor TaxID=4558 RepID=A0A921QB45_SORBI|nr:hypothetical protein BDA96_09G115600 [Sorghum bicolor]OQU77839.1 hypothetical protein SORBI_3009G110333 [Sorghum bicolor]
MRQRPLPVRRRRFCGVAFLVPNAAAARRLRCAVLRSEILVTRFIDIVQHVDREMVDSIILLSHFRFIKSFTPVMAFLSSGDMALDLPLSSTGECGQSDLY